MNIGVAIKRLRLKRGLKQKDFAVLLGISACYLSQVENGKRKPNLGIIENISDKLNIPIPVMFWFGVDESDVGEDKKGVYKLLKPSIDAQMDSLFN